MKLPRDISGSELAIKLAKYSYEVTRQNGSHIRLTTQYNGEHHRHDPLKIGTFSAILNDVGKHLEMSRDELIENLF